jgi:hypothetical protein
MTDVVYCQRQRHESCDVVDVYHVMSELRQRPELNGASELRGPVDEEQRSNACGCDRRETNVQDLLNAVACSAFSTETTTEPRNERPRVERQVKAKCSRRAECC